MTNAQEIEKFVKLQMEKFGFYYADIVGDVEGEDGKLYDAPIAEGENLNIERVCKAAEAFGISPDAIISMDYNQFDSQREKYPFIDLLNDYWIEYQKSFIHPDFWKSQYSKSSLLLATMFGKYGKLDNRFVPQLYNNEDIKQRLELLLKQYDVACPGAYHEGAEITNLHFTTQNLFHYRGIEELCGQFLDMVDRAEVLFFKALDSELPLEEVNEYNLIVSIIGLTDAVLFTRGYLYYSTLRKLRPVYKEECHTNFFDYVRLSRYRFIYPYLCAEFATKRSLVERFSKIYPFMKRYMREYSQNVRTISCAFVWSDDMHKTGAERFTHIFLPKTNEELNGCEQYAELYRTLSGPTKLGGVKKAEFPYSPPCEPKRMIARLEAIRGGRADG